MVKNIFRILLPLLMLSSLLAGCEKVWIDTTFYIKTFVQQYDKGEVTPTDQVVGHIFYVADTSYHVASYEDALNGIMTNKYTGNVIYADITDSDPVLTGDYTETGNPVYALALDGIKQLDFTVVLCLTSPYFTAREKYVYAWRKTNTLKNLEAIYLSFTFTPWRAQGEYVSGNWQVVDDGYQEPEPEPEPEPDEDGEE